MFMYRGLSKSKNGKGFVGGTIKGKTTPITESKAEIGVNYLEMYMKGFITI